MVENIKAISKWLYLLFSHLYVTFFFLFFFFFSLSLFIVTFFLFLFLFLLNKIKSKSGQMLSRNQIKILSFLFYLACIISKKIQCSSLLCHLRAAVEGGEDQRVYLWSSLSLSCYIFYFLDLILNFYGNSIIFL